MTIAPPSLKLGLSLIPLPVGPAFAQIPTDEATSEARAATPAAFVYVQTAKGVDVYDAIAAGKLALVSGSRFATSGLDGLAVVPKL
jgi:hypothetical protein